MRAVLILAGGAARRLPGKLELEFRGEPLILRVFRNVQSAGPVYVASNRTFARRIDDEIACPIIIDRHPGSGPLAAVFDALSVVSQTRVFLVGGDMPFVTACVADEIERAWRPGIDACIGVDAHGNVQPLCGLYDRAALLNAAGDALRAGKQSLKSALDRLHILQVRVKDDHVFAGVNTPEDLVAVRTFDLGLHTRA